MQFKIFVSYSTLDLEHVDLLKQQLHGTSVEVFIAEHSVKPSENIGQKVTEAIKQCDVFVVLWGKNAQDSGWVSQEIGQAEANNKTILPLVLSENVPLSGFISNLKYIPVYKNPKKAIQEAREVILDSYNKKAQAIANVKQKDNDALAMLGIGTALFFLFTKLSSSSKCNT